MNAELPDGWASIRLEDLVSSRKGKKPAVAKSSPSDGFLPYLDIQAIEKSEVSNYAESVSSRLATIKDILVVWDGARSGWVGLGRDGAIGSTIMALLPKTGDRLYLYRWLQNQFDHINSNTRGTGIPHVDPEVFWNLDLPFPPLDEQRRIVAKLENLLGRVDACQQRLAKIPILLKRFRQSVLAAACSGRLTTDWREENQAIEDAGALLDKMRRERRERCSTANGKRKYRESAAVTDEDLPEIPKTWRWTNFDHCAWEITVGHVGPMKDRYSENGAAFLRCQNVRPLRFDPAGLVRIPRDFQKELAKSKLVGGEILVVRSGANTGDCCVFPRDVGEANCADLVITRPLSGLNASYGALYVNSPEGQARLILNQTGIAQPHFNIGAMRVKAFPLPPQREQQEIVRRVENLFMLANRIESRFAEGRKRVSSITKAILAKAFRGELVPTEYELAKAEGRSFESAEELFQRIRQNGDAKQKTQKSARMLKTAEAPPRKNRHLQKALRPEV